MKIIAAVCAAVLLLAGCSGSTDDEPRPDRTPSVDQTADQKKKAADDELAQRVADEAESARGTVVDITIKDGKVTPQGGRVDVKVGQKVTLNITSDADEEIHVHSEPEHSYEVTPGAPVTESFTLKTPGQVAVEAHHLDVTIVQLVVRP